MLRRLCFWAALSLVVSMGTLLAEAACIDLKQTGGISFEGVLSYRIYPGPPNYDDVRKGDTPEPTYILTLDAPTCAAGDDFITPDTPFQKVQIYPAEAEGARQGLWRDLRQLLGKRVSVEGKGAFGAHTGPRTEVLTH